MLEYVKMKTNGAILIVAVLGFGCFLSFYAYARVADKPEGEGVKIIREKMPEAEEVKEGEEEIPEEEVPGYIISKEDIVQQGLTSIFPELSIEDADMDYVIGPLMPTTAPLPGKRLSFGLSSYETYDDNVYLTKDNTRFDYIVNLLPKASGFYGYEGFGGNVFFVNYRGEMLIYSYHPDQTRYNQTISGVTALFLRSPLQVTVTDSISFTSDPASSEQTDIIPRVFNRLESIAKYEISPKTAFSFSYKQIIQNYLPSSHRNNSYMLNIVTPLLQWEFSPKTFLTAEYNMGIYDYYKGGNKDKNCIYQQPRIGIMGTLTPKSTIWLKAGFQYREFYEAANKPISGTIFHGIYNYAFSPKTTFELVAAQAINESLYANEDYSNGAYIYSAVLWRPVTYLNFKAGGFYANTKYPHEQSTEYGNVVKRADHLYGFTLSGEYIFKDWVSAFAGYEYRIKVSNVRSAEYKNNRISCGLKLEF